MIITKESISETFRQTLIDHCYDVIGCMHSVYRELSPGLPEPIFQESLLIALQELGYTDAQREYHHYPSFRNRKLSTHIQLDLMVPKAGMTIVIECKSILKLSDRERIQLYGYLRGTEFPIGILVNFGSYPKAEIERYYYDRKRNTITAF